MADETKPDGSERAADRSESCGDAAAKPVPAAAPRRRRRSRAAAGAPAAAGRAGRGAATAGRADSRSRRQDDDRGVGRRRRCARPRAPAGERRRRDADDTSPLLTRRAWMGLAWGAFSAASAAALAATGRFMFPNVLNEPPQQFKAGFPNEYGMGVDERWKEKFGIWLVRTPEDIDAARQRLLRADHDLHAPRLHAELSVGGEQVQVPVPRQRLPHDRRQLRRARRRGRSSARASCWPTTARSSSTRAGSSSASSGSGPIPRRF